MAQHFAEPSSDSIIQTGTSFWKSKILFCAVKLELFTKLAETKYMSSFEVKSNLGLKCTDRNVFDFLDALTTFGFLERKGLLDTARYSNSVDTDFYLDKKKSTYIGGALVMLNNRNYCTWNNFEEGLLTGLSQCYEALKGGCIYDLYLDDDKFKEFIHAMSGLHMGSFMFFAQNFDFLKQKTLVDIGGSAGLLSLTVAKHQPHMNCISWDLPAVTAVANKVIQKFDLQDRIKTMAGDFFKDKFPNGDIITMANTLHNWDENTKLMVMKKAFEALSDGGAFIAIDYLIDDDRKKNGFSLMMSLNMLVETGTGFGYTFAEFNKWVKAIGFKSTSLLNLEGESSAAIAYK